MSPNWSKTCGPPVADLRTAPGPTLTARLLQSTSGLDGVPQVVVDLEERRPLGPQ